MSENRKFLISTDGTADLNDDCCEKNGIFVHPLFYFLEDKPYGGIDGEQIPYSEYYRLMREDHRVSTSANNPDTYSRIFTSQVEQGYDILHFSFSSGLSSMHDNARIAAGEVMEEHPEAKIEVYDSLSCSAGQGLMIHYANKLREEGKTLEETVKWLNENRLCFCHEFTVEHLKYLQRGGRVSKAAAIVGALINVKPVLHVDNEGHLVPVFNVRGRKKALISLVDNMEKHIDRDRCDTVFIGHADALEDARFVGSLVTERFGITNITYSYISYLVGTHAGPGTIALFYIGKER